MWIVWLEKRILKTLGIILGIIIILITALHVYVVNNAESLVEEIVARESNGKLKLTVDNIKFNYFSKKVEFKNVTFYSNDSLDLKTAYYFQVDKIQMRVKALLPIFTRRELRIDSLALVAPKIEVTRLKPLERPSHKEVSIPEEMGRVYNSIMDALKFLEVKRFQFDEGEFRLINKVHADQQPLVITKLHFHIEDFKVDSTTSAEDFPDSDKLVFWTKNQDITFPDGNHRLAFSRFRIKIKKRLIEIDSCTLIGKKDGNSQSGFSLFLDTLKLTNVDFKALYEQDLIKADSVYCLNPNFKIQLELKNRGPGERKIPNLDTLINQLTGDLQLKYVGVKNATLDITTTRDDKSTRFTSEKNNFEMQGLTIIQNSPQPVSLQSFDMAIRNYENFVKDSSYFLRFDSIQLRENRVYLNNFSINTEPYKDKRNIQVRQFILSGLSWADLLFDRQVVAKQALLIRPVIDYYPSANARPKTRNPIVNSLAGINNFMSLDKIVIDNGKIKIKTRNTLDLLLDDANLVLNSSNIADSLSISNVEGSIEMLNFKKGIMKIKGLTVNMDNASFDGNTNQFLFDKINIYNRGQTFNVNARNVRLDSLVYLDSVKMVWGEGISWKKADVEINVLQKGKGKNSDALDVFLKRIGGTNTQLYFNDAKNSLSVFLSDFAASSIDNKNRLKIDDLKTSGTQIYWFNQRSSFTAERFSINDHAGSSLGDFHFKQTKENNTIEISAEQALFTPDVNSVIKGASDIKDLKLDKPVVYLRVDQKTDSNRLPLPKISVDQLQLNDPIFSLENNTPEALKKIEWDGKETNIILKNLKSNPDNNRISVSSINTKLSNFQITNKDNKTTSSKEGSLQIQLSDLVVGASGKKFWSVTIDKVDARNFSADSLGKNPANVKVHEGSLRDLNLGSSISGNLKRIIEKNPSFKLSDVSGEIMSEKNNWKWYNLSFDKPRKSFTLDSFFYEPVATRDEFIAASKWQTDYMTIKTGKIAVSRFDLDEYLGDSVFRSGTVTIDDPYFTSYRDKRPPFHAGIIKPLPAKLIQKIPEKVSVDTIIIRNGTAIYSELNDKTGETGVIPITRISGDIFPIKNFDLRPADSFRIRLNGYLLDSGWIRLRTRESYLDSLSGFLITVRMRPHSMMYLNQILPALSSIKLQSGYLDTLTMRAIGRDDISLGEMRMYYHDLKVQFLKNGREDKKTFLRGLMTFIANSFIIKNENKKRVGVVYFPRLRDRSFINYYIKIAMSGVASSVGAKKNKRLMKRYNKTLKVRQLPGVDFD
ncbi:MAG TPA: hypothetical protein VFP97_10420 [Chitinophagaceae bacterium]|nr:hypothetical protein [Chitinophagaceae bacterium]